MSGPPGDVAAALIDALGPGAGIGVAVHDERERAVVAGAELVGLVVLAIFNPAVLPGVAYAARGSVADPAHVGKTRAMRSRRLRALAR